MNHLNQNYGLQDIPEPFRGQNKDLVGTSQTEPQAAPSSSSARSWFNIEDLLLILLLFLLLSDYK